MSNFVTYNSSAGSGKTFTLVKEYLKIALATDNPNNYRHILAITFTNKAAAEMKERVLSALIALSGSKPTEGTSRHLLEALMQSQQDGGLGIGKEVIQSRSAEVLKAILHNYNDFGISTIDKFTHKIVRTFAHDLQLPINFNVELEEEDVLKASIDLLITAVGSNEKLTQLLTEYALKKSEEEKSWSLDYDLLQFAKKLLRDDGELYLEKLRQLTLADFEKIKKSLQEQAGSFDDKVQEMAKNALDFVRDKGIEPESFSRSFYTNYWLKTIEKGDFSPTATALKIFNGAQNWYAKKVAEEQKALIDEHAVQLTEMFHASQEFAQENLSDYLEKKSLLKNLYNLAVLNEVEKTLLEFKQENNILNISDFNKRIASIVSNEPTPFIYERLGEKYDHYLIDEFQDTSVTQWHNLLPLVDNSLAKGKFNMVVGDAKQAIYRWRGGEVEQLIKFPRVYRHNDNPILLEREESLVRNFNAQELNTNYRSKAEIVDFNNHFFRHAAENLNENYRTLYAGLNQEFDSKNTGGGVEIVINQETDSQIYKEFNLKYIFKCIENCLNDGYQWKDIAILTRGKEEGKIIASYLLSENIDVISAESLLLNSSAEVQFVLDLIRHINDPSDVHCQIRAMNYLTEKEGGDLFQVVAKFGEFPLTAYLVTKNLELNVGSLNHLNLYELVEHLLVHFDLNDEMDIYLQFFLDKVHEYSTKNDHAIPNFLEWWSNKSNKFTIVIPEGVNAVQVMTIHKSKGLEFPVVIFPFADKGVKLGEDFFWTQDTSIDNLDAAIVPLNKSILDTRFAPMYELEMDKSRLDLINLMYVAFTRPEQRLYVVTKIGQNRSANGSMGDYLHDFCLQHNQYDPQNGVLRLGDFSTNKSKASSSASQKVLTETTYANWRERLKISYQAPVVWDVDAPESIGEYGNLVHAVLAKIKHKRDLPKVLDSLVAKGILEEENLAHIKELITALFCDEQIGYLFEENDALMNERTILLPSGQAYQPDRVVVKEGKTYLVDFKTGAKESKHQEQLLNYRNLLVDMGYENVVPLLLYIQEKELVEVG